LVDPLIVHAAVHADNMQKKPPGGRVHSRAHSEPRGQAASGQRARGGSRVALGGISLMHPMDVAGIKAAAGASTRT